MIAKLIAEVAKLIAAIAVMFWKMNVNYLMMILPKEIHIEFRKKNHRDNMGIEDIDNKHIVEEYIVGVAEHTAEVAEHIVGVVASVVEAVVADIDNKHIHDVNYANTANAANAANAAEEDIEGNIQQGVFRY